MLPRIPVRLRIDPAFAMQARYTFVMLGLMGDWIPDFTPLVPDQDCLVYSIDPPDSARLWIPASARAQGLLTARIPVLPCPRTSSPNSYDCLGLFPVSVDGQEDSDPVAESFFFLSLHEEWTSEQRDCFQRFEASSSLLGKHGLLHLPIVSLIAKGIQSELVRKGFKVETVKRFHGLHSAVCLTHDIDYLHKWTPGLAFDEVFRRFLRGKGGGSFTSRWQRLREYVGFGSADRDPYKVSILKFLEMEREVGIRSTWYFKAGGRDKRDVSYSLRNSWLRTIFQRLEQDGHEIGLHPSFHAHVDRKLLAREFGRLSAVTNSPINGVRQHYLRFEYPRTWRNQVSLELKTDSTLGFAMHEGYRNGTAHPFLPFDLEGGKPLPLWEAPLLAMDGTFTSYRHLTPESALSAMEGLRASSSALGGISVLLFHNTCFDPHQFPGWDSVYTNIVRSISDGTQLCAPVSETIHAWLGSAGLTTQGILDLVLNNCPCD